MMIPDFEVLVRGGRSREVGLSLLRRVLLGVLGELTILRPA